MLGNNGSSSGLGVRASWSARKQLKNAGEKQDFLDCNSKKDKGAQKEWEVCNKLHIGVVCDLSQLGFNRG